MTRPSWDDYFLAICDVVATRATCDRRHVGAVLIKDNRIIGTGYNGAIPGEAHCSDPPLFFECIRCGKKWLKDQLTVSDLYGQLCGDPLCKAKVIERHGGHQIEDNHCHRVVHAEMNALLTAARLGNQTEGSIIYCNTTPCYNCFKSLVTAGIKEVVYSGTYKPDERVLGYTGIRVRQYTPQLEVVLKMAQS